MPLENRNHPIGYGRRPNPYKLATGGPWDTAHNRLFSEVLATDSFCTVELRFTSSIRTLPKDTLVISANLYPAANRANYGLKLHHGYAMVVMTAKTVNVTIYSASIATLEALIPLFTEHYKGDESFSTEKEVSVCFWTSGKHGPSYEVRKIVVPVFENIKDNYSVRVKDQLQKLFQYTSPQGGKLILWHGMPGTGKTYALRSLMHAWDDWARFYYFVNPEAFFIYNPEDLMHTMFTDVRRSDEVEYVGDPEEDFSDGETQEEDALDESPWKVFIMEDTGEMLTPDAKEKVGQGVSRLLNLLDGILGQGLKIMFIITTNESEGSMHQALLRNGRCWSNIEFTPLSVEEANRWLQISGQDRVVSQPITIADLYGDPTHTTTQKGIVGFEAPHV